MHRYYKISPKWAKRLGVAKEAPKHPDGLYLVTPQLGDRIIEELRRETGVTLLRAEAFEAIGAIGMNVQEALASKRGDLKHEIPDEGEDTAGANVSEGNEMPVEAGGELEAGSQETATDK